MQLPTTTLEELATAFRAGDDARCLRLLEEIEAGAPAVQALLLHLQAWIEFRRGDQDAGRSALNDAAEIARNVNAVLAAEHTSHAGVLLAHLDGDTKRARDYYMSTFRTVHSMNNRRGMAQCLRSLGELALLHGKLDQARSCWARAEALLEELGLPDREVMSAWLAAIEYGDGAESRRSED